MSCNSFITKGRLGECLTDISGFKAIGFMLKKRHGLTLEADDTWDAEGIDLEDPSPADKIFEFELSNLVSNSYTETITTENNPLYAGEASLTLRILDKETRNQIKLLVAGEFHAFLVMNNGEYLVLGAEFGARVTGGTLLTGENRNSQSGFTLTITTEERRPVVFAGADGKAAYEALVDRTAPITPGAGS